MLWAVIVALLVAGATSATYPRQVRAYLTHWKGSPGSTTAYIPAAIEPGLVRIAVAGDVGDSGTRLARTAAAISRAAGPYGYDGLLLLGDNVYPSGDPQLLRETVLDPFAALLASGTELMAIVGNHDVRRGNGPRQMAALGMDGLWWSTEIGDVLFVGLDSNQPDNAEQRRWLQRTLDDTTARWKIVSLHHPPYSAGYQGSSVDVRDAFATTFERFGVQLVLSGHDHDYQRSVPIRGTTYVVSGAAAGSRRTSERDFTAASFSWHHFLELDIYADRLIGRAVNQSGRVADVWTLSH